MGRIARRSGLVGAFCLALVALGAPASARAGTLTFRNDTDGPIIVQGMSYVNGVLRQGKRHTLQPGDTGTDLIVVAGNKLIIVLDAKQPTRILYRNAIQCGAANLTYSIQKDDTPAPNSKSKPKSTDPATQASPKVKLVPDLQPMNNSPSSSPQRRP